MEIGKEELFYRQQSANFMYDVGRELRVSQLSINTGVVLMHKYHAVRSFSRVQRYDLATAALFYGLKVEEERRKLEHVIKAAHYILYRNAPPLDVRTNEYKEKETVTLFYENEILQTLGFDVVIQHPHMHVVEACKFVKANKELSTAAYSLATASLLLTAMCVQYRPTLVACICMHLACKWTGWKIEPSSEGKEWYYYVDKTVHPDILETLTLEFIQIIESSPEKYKRRFMTAQKRNEKPHSVAKKRTISLQAYREKMGQEKRRKVTGDIPCMENPQMEPRGE